LATVARLFAFLEGNLHLCESTQFLSSEDNWFEVSLEKRKMGDLCWKRKIEEFRFEKGKLRKVFGEIVLKREI
jgi:hypothetical protein